MCLQQPPENIQYAALVIGGSFVIEGINHCFMVLADWFFLMAFSFKRLSLKYIHSLGASLIVAIQAVKKGAAAEGMTVRDYIWRGHDPTSVAVMTEVIHLTFIHLWFMGRGT